jgi:hypothetical protein
MYSQDVGIKLIGVPTQYGTWSAFIISEYCENEMENLISKQTLNLRYCSNIYIFFLILKSSA